MKYSWKKGYNAKVSASIAGEEVKRINEKYSGKLEAKYIVKESSGKDSPLYNCFEWNNKSAAEIYRVDQASRLIRALVFVDVKRKITKTTRAFVHVRDNPGDIHESGYYDIYTVLSDSALRKKAIQQAWKELEQWREKYKEYKELIEIFQIVDKKSPCDLCELVDKSKDNSRCVNCEKRIEYLKRMEAA